jgi:acetyl-CoA carboxylase biotin carboxylase subunit
VIEEAPSPLNDPALRAKMGETAVNIAKAAHYYSVGTLEFLVDVQRNFYFLEMNTRLQVEHPVTELVTGIDLVREQIRIAAGERLTIQQDDVQMLGHAVECRVYAEDPEKNFLPSPGKITKLRTPSGPGVRDDSGVYEGWDVPLFYDPMISKLATYGATREEAINRMQRALREYHVGGIRTTIPFFQEVLDDAEFRSGEIDTGFIARYFERRAAQPKPEASSDLTAAEIAAAMVAAFDFARQQQKPVANTTQSISKWKAAGRVASFTNR